MIRRLHKKKNISKKKKYFPAARVVLFYLTRPTGNDFLLKGGLILKSSKNHAPARCTGSKTYAPGHQIVHTGCRVHP